METRDTKEYFDLLSKIDKSYQISEDELILKVENTDITDIKNTAHNFFGKFFKRLIGKNYFTGEIRRNNLEKEFVIEWIYRNNKVSQNGKGKEYLADQILGKQCSQEELIMTSTIIQWLGTNAGMDFIQKVTKTDFTNKIG